MVIQIRNTTGALFSFSHHIIQVVHWHVLSPHSILSVKIRITFKSTNKPLSGMLGETTAVKKTRPTSKKHIEMLQSGQTANDSCC